MNQLRFHKTSTNCLSRHKTLTYSIINIFLSLYFDLINHLLIILYPGNHILLTRLETRTETARENSKPPKPKKKSDACGWQAYSETPGADILKYKGKAKREARDAKEEKNLYPARASIMSRVFVTVFKKKFIIGTRVRCSPFLLLNSARERDTHAYYILSNAP